MRAPIALLAATLLSGCITWPSEVQPMDQDPIPMRAPLLAQGGHKLLVDEDGTLIARPDPDIQGGSSTVSHLEPIRGQRRTP